MSRLLGTKSTRDPPNIESMHGFQPLKPYQTALTKIYFFINKLKKLTPLYKTKIYQYSYIPGLWSTAACNAVCFVGPE